MKYFKIFCSLSNRRTHSIIMRQLSSVMTKANCDIAVEEKYKEAVATLNTLQSNAQALADIRRNNDRNRHQNIPNVIQFLSRVGLKVDDLNRLNIIHITGTKGKGSTCSFCDSILRHHGYKVGLYSSPHLVETRERIMVDGLPISKEKFVTYFWHVYNRLEETKDLYNGQMPKFFCFLTVMAFYVFMQENVDAAIIEVGIGGLFDSTNVVKRPVVCGVTSLGLDHTSILGSSLSSIAFHKSGIFKTDVPVVTTDQPAEALKVLLERAKEFGSPIYTAPTLCQYHSSPGELKLGIDGAKQRINASIALQICKLWMEHKSKDQRYSERRDDIKEAMTVADIPVLPGFSLKDQFETALKSCCLPGRHQILPRSNVTFYLDGAHTAESLEDCSEWFNEMSDREELHLRKQCVKILIFNMTGDRNSEILLRKLQVCNFQAALFCPNKQKSSGNREDLLNRTVSPHSQLSRTKELVDTWDILTREKIGNGSKTPTNSIPESIADYKIELPIDGQIDEVAYTKQLFARTDKTAAYMFDSISDTLCYACHGRETFDSTNTENSPPKLSIQDSDHIQVLICGSLHLVGGTLDLLMNELGINIFTSNAIEF